jgi:hypothetical protein
VFGQEKETVPRVIQVLSSVVNLLKQCCGSGSGTRDEHLSIYFRELRKIFWVKKILKFFDVDQDPESFLPWIRDRKSGIRAPV